MLRPYMCRRRHEDRTGKSAYATDVLPASSSSLHAHWFQRLIDGKGVVFNN